MRVRLLSWNIHKGLNWSSRSSDLEAMRDWVRLSNADLVAFQELRGSERQLEYLADTLWPHHAYGQNAATSGGDHHHGNAIMSRWPIERVHNLDLTLWRLERRGALHAVIRIPERSKPLHLLSVHLDLFQSNRDEQLEKVIRYISAAIPGDEPVLLAGDFNDWRIRACEALRQRLGMREAFRELRGEPARTFPTHWPVARLDRVYARGPSIRWVSAEPTRAARYPLGDHLSLQVELDLFPK